MNIAFVYVRIDASCMSTISKDKIAVCEKTAGLRSGNSSYLDSACLKALVAVEIFQFSHVHYESRFLDTFRGHNIRPKRF